jgi:hypothetical protein
MPYVDSYFISESGETWRAMIVQEDLRGKMPYVDSNCILTQLLSNNWSGLGN